MFRNPPKPDILQRAVANIATGSDSAGMPTADQSRLSTLLQRKQRSNRVAALMKAWSAIGARPSVLSDDLHDELVDRLRQGERRRRAVAGPLDTVIVEFAKPLDMVVVVSWSIDDEPALLVPADVVARSEPHLRRIYPDGLVLAATSFAHAVIIDFDDGALHVDDVRIKPAL